MLENEALTLVGPVTESRVRSTGDPAVNPLYGVTRIPVAPVEEPCAPMCNAMPGLIGMYMASAVSLEATRYSADWAG